MLISECEKGFLKSSTKRFWEIYRGTMEIKIRIFGLSSSNLRG